MPLPQIALTTLHRTTARNCLQQREDTHACIGATNVRGPCSHVEGVGEDNTRAFALCWPWDCENHGVCREGPAESYICSCNE